MGIGMKTKKDNSSTQGTINHAPKQKKAQSKNVTQRSTIRKSTNSSTAQDRLQNRPRKRTPDAQYKTIPKERKVQQHSSSYEFSPYEEEENFAETTIEKKSHNKLVIAIVVFILALVLLFAGLFAFSQVKSLSNKNSGGQNTTPSVITNEEDTEAEEKESPEEGTTLEDGFETGDNNKEGGKYEEGTLSKTTPDHYSSSDFLKDLNGYEIPAVYTVQNITYDVAHVNYQAKRATIDDGMEFYWLEIDYNGKKYRAQCSYNMFRNLESEGICKVAVEILTLDSGQQVVSYMKVVSEDYTVEDAENDFNF